MEIEEKARAAFSAQTEELWKLLKEHHPRVILRALLNRNLSEEMAVFIAKKRGISAEALEMLAYDGRFKDSYALKLAICRNPRTPQKIIFSNLKFLRVFDLSDLTKEQALPLNVRQKIEQAVSEKIPSMPLGVRTALARRANGTVVTMLLEQGDEAVIDACLDNPILTEGFLFRIINKKTTKPLVIRMIAGHRKWSLRYSIRFALVRNFHTPMKCALKFIAGMKSPDLKELHADPKLPASTRPFIFNELLRRKEGTEAPEEEIYTISYEEE